MNLSEIIEYYIEQALAYERVSISLERSADDGNGWERTNKIDSSRRLAGELWVKIERLLKISKAVGQK